ncbi:MAG: hypothetical protein WBI12_04050 [Methanosarcina flavescens]|uniref:hypothetical protein n=1 Tax=Methanosarcina flavescens TaxID=1715806 RepID=UPI0014355354|nr:hypothetical protein [Methanosarcina flavescens]
MYRSYKVRDSIGLEYAIETRNLETRSITYKMGMGLGEVISSSRLAHEHYW